MLRSYLPFAVLMAMAYLLYTQAFSGVWLMDDLPVLVNNPDIRSFGNFLEDYYPGRPLRELSYLVDYRLFGLDPSGYYIQQIFWHGLCAGLVFLTARLLQAPAAVAWLAALLFLVHPVQVEVVANISHRKDSLALAFSLLSFCSYLRARSDAPPRKRWLLAALLFWGIAMTAKQNAVAVVLVVAACELYKLPRRIRPPAFGTATILGFAAVTGWLVHLGNSQAFRAEIGPALRKLGHFSGGTVEEYFLTACKAWALMFSKLAWPVELSMEYTFPIPDQWLDPWVVCGLIGMLGAALGFLWAINHFLPVYIGLSWFLAFWLPTSNLLGHLSYFAADRYWYAPSVGVFLLAAYGAWRLSREKLKVYVLLAALVLPLLGWQSWRQQSYWCDARAFYEHMQQVNPDALEGLIGLGAMAMEEGDFAAAVDNFQKAYLRDPSDARIPQNLGYIAYMQGQYDAALGYFTRALALDPQRIEVYNNLGSVYDELGQPDMAIEALSRAIAINSHFEKAYTNMGMVYEKMGQLQKAEELHRRALQERPDYGQAYYNLGNTLYHAGRKPEALEAYAVATRLSPEDADALYNYAVVAQELGQKNLLPALLARLRTLDARLADELERELR